MSADRLRALRGSAAEIALLVAIAAVSATIVAWFWEFTADDAYIYMRVAENLVDYGSLGFNRGERVMVPTSTLLVFLEGMLYALTGATRIAYKVVSLLLVALSAALAVRAQPPDALRRGIAAAIVLLPPSVVLWTVGGMEVPLLMAIVTGATYLALDVGPERPGRSMAVLFLAGLGYLTRQDAAPYMGALAAYALVGQPRRTIARAVAVGAFLPVVWSAVSLAHFGDLLPTSFYVKTPRGGAGWLTQNAIYVAEFLALTGALPFAVWTAVEHRSWRTPPDGARAPRTIPWGPWVGLALQLVYSLTMATVHMMFAFRAVVPYLPAIVVLTGDLASRGRPAGQRRVGALAGALVALVALQIAQAATTYRRSVQGWTTTGELRTTPLVQFMAAMPRSERLIEAVEAHWQSLPARPREHPRILTLAEGLIPYRYRDAYFFGTLISYRRHCHTDPQWADYMLFGVPPSTSELPGQVASEPFTFGGRDWRMVAVYNPSPRPGGLPDTVGGACPVRSPGR